MTLIIKAITKNWAFSVSDRLLTQRMTDGYKPFDAVSNKTVLFFPSDAIVSISYTGTAYIEKTSTDRWISEKLCGLDLSEGKDFVLGIENGIWKNLYFSMENLIMELNKVWPKLEAKQRKNDIGILISVWHKPKSNWQPVLWWLKGDGEKESPFYFERHKKFWGQRQISTVCSPIKPTKDESSRLEQSILNERNHGTEKTAEKAIVNEIRERAKNHPTIGLDCMAIRISYNANPNVIINYYPNPNIQKLIPPMKADKNNRTGLIIGYGKLEDFQNGPPDIEGMEPYFSPWIVSKNSVIPPSSILGIQNSTINNFTVQINGAHPPKGIIGGHISQKRPEKP